jgi:hypothetical protein
VQINIGSNDVSNALFKADKNGSKSSVETRSEIGAGATVTNEQPIPAAEIMPELEPKEENILGAFDNLQRAFSKGDDDGK